MSVLKRNRRGPKSKPEDEKKVRVSIWVKKKYVELAEAELGRLELKFEDEKKMNKEIAKMMADA